MNATESNLLVRADQMNESTLIRLEDWELAHLRLAMLHQVKETLEASLVDCAHGADEGCALSDRDHEPVQVCVSEDPR